MEETRESRKNGSDPSSRKSDEEKKAPGPSSCSQGGAKLFVSPRDGGRAPGGGARAAGRKARRARRERDDETTRRATMARDEVSDAALPGPRGETGPPSPPRTREGARAPGRRGTCRSPARDSHRGCPPPSSRSPPPRRHRPSEAPWSPGRGFAGQTSARRAVRALRVAEGGAALFGPKISRIPGARGGGRDLARTLPRRRG